MTFFGGLTKYWLLGGLIVLLLIAGSGMLLVKSVDILDDATIDHKVTGGITTYLTIDVRGLEHLKPLSDKLTINLNLPQDFSVQLPTEFTGKLDLGEGRVHHDGTVTVEQR